MKKTLLFIILLILSSASNLFAEELLSPKQLAEMVYNRDIGKDMQLEGTMELISQSGQIRSRSFISMRKDTDTERKQLIRFTAPADIDGTGFLTVEPNKSDKTEQHLYLPALKRTRRIVASQKGRSFVNSDFTYEDMQRHPVEDWEYQLNEDQIVNDLKCYVLISTPLKKTKTKYGKLISWIEKEHLLPLKTIFYDKKGNQIKQYRVLKFEAINNIATETEVLMEDLESGHKTRLLSQNIRYNTGLKSSLFTTRALER